MPAQIIDGDTILLANVGSVRLLGVDAPELDEPGGHEAKDKLIATIGDKSLCPFGGSVASGTACPYAATTADCSLASARTREQHCESRKRRTSYRIDN